MIYRSDRIYVTPTTYADDFYSYIHQYYTNVSHEDESTDITFDNKFTLRIPKSQSRPPVQLVFDNEEINIASFGYMPEACYVDTILIIDTNILYFYITRVGYSNEGNGGFVWVVDQDNKNFVGGISIISTNIGNIERATFYDVDEESTTPYSLGKIFDFEYGFNKLLYTDSCPISFANGYSSLIPGLIPCSTVTPKQIITFGGKGYYSIGTNNLIQID